MSNTSVTYRKDFFEESLFKNLTMVFFWMLICYINGALLYTFFTNQTFNNIPRYILYVQLIINDSIMLSISVLLFILGYTCPYLNVSLCIVLILIGNNVHKNTPLNLAGMAIERFVAICYPLQHPTICTVNRTYIFISCIWIVGAIPGLVDVIIAFALKPLSYFSTGKLCYQSNAFNTDFNYRNNFSFNMLYLCFVWVTLIYTYIRVMFSAKAAASDPAKAKKAQTTILLHGVQLLLCMMSYIAPVVEISLILAFPNLRSVIMFCSYLIANMSPRLLSPLIYGLRDQNFKKHIKGSLFCRQTDQSVKPARAPK